MEKYSIWRMIHQHISTLPLYSIYGVKSKRAYKFLLIVFEGEDNLTDCICRCDNNQFGPVGRDDIDGYDTNYGDSEVSQHK